MRVSHIERRIDQQLRLCKIIAYSYDDLTRIGLNKVTSHRIETRLSHLKESWEEFCLVHKSIMISIPDLSKEDQQYIKNHMYFVDEIYNNTREGYLESLERFTALSETTQSSIADSITPSTSRPPNIQAYEQLTTLPRMNIPKFDGTQSEWLPFKNLFKSMIISNPRLSEVQKLQYLKTNLHGHAFQLVKHTPLLEENFQKTWDSLIAFYENTRQLVDTTLQSLLSLKPITKESATELQQFYTSLTQIYSTLEILERPIAYWDDLLIVICVRKLDHETMKLWQTHLGPTKDPPTWNQFRDFLFSRFSSLQSIEKAKHGRVLHQSNASNAKVHHQSQNKDNKSIAKGSCGICSENHFTSACSQYLNKTIDQKLAIISKYKLCYNCLGSHRVSNCKNSKRCQKCGRKHHTTIHKSDASSFKDKENSRLKEETSSTNTKPEEPKVLHSHINNYSVLLATAQVLLTSSVGRTIKVRALLDQGSEVSLITERVTQRLRLPRKHSSPSLLGIGAQRSTKTKGATSFILKPHFESDFEIPVNAYILSKLTSSLPSIQHNEEAWPHLQGLRLADPLFTEPESIDVILGADVYGYLIEEGIVKGTLNTPVAQSTKLGWVISGVTNLTSTNNQIHGYHVTVDEELNHLIKRLWEIEEFSTSNIPTMSDEEQACEDHFRSTHSRNSDGRYIVKLPFKEPPEKLGDSKVKALRLINNVFNRFSNNPQYARDYSNFIQEYKDLNHMQRVTDTQIEPDNVYYLPHHGIYKENNLSSKLKVVFNGSSKTTTGLSLNQILHQGVKLQLNIFNVLTWFRSFRYVFFADVERMYRQIQLHPDDWNFQRILWIDLAGRLIIFVLTTIIYGLICSPNVALRTFEQLIEDEGHRFPRAIPTMRKGRYIDDVFGGADTVEEATEVATQVDQLCMAGCFPLKKWISNNPAVLRSIPVDKHLSKEPVQIDTSSMVHALGLSWQPSTDQFIFTLNLEEPKAVTKRTILSTLAKIFDPLGFISPVTISCKLLIQELWSSGLEWDDPLPPHLLTKWTNFVTRIREASNLTFPRWMGFNCKDSFEIHGFCDASESAMAAIVFLRSISSTGSISIKFIASKTKVAPLKKLTIPRLELQGATLLTKLMNSVLLTLDRHDLKIFAWTDSQIAYYWIINHPSQLKDFVRNRVAFIKETLPQCKWGLVPGIQNPADLATRGLSPSQLQENSTWWTGPDWLSQDKSAWPRVSVLPFMDNLELRKKQISTIIRDTDSKVWDLVSRYSNLARLLKITALCRKFVDRIRKINCSSPNLPTSVVDKENAKLFWIKQIQTASFPSEFKILSKGQSLPSSNSLAILTPFIDSNGLLRVGGRLQKSLLPETSKHPFILPKDSTFTNLLIDDAHTRTLHGGTQVTLSFLRQNYWIVKGRPAVRSFILKCVRCARFRQHRAQQLMGQLPQARVTPSRPFLHSGVDYAGPIVIKTWKGKNARTYKAYIALFVCFATSAIHLELVTDYSSDAFIAAYKRFTSRRGICASLTSDCGTNFQGADKELKRLFSRTSKELGTIASVLVGEGTQWKFNPPSAPHFGGKWEAGVKSVKTHLKRVIGDKLLTYEELNTLLIQIEAVLNSRPLCPLSDDPDDLSVLTPGHFLIGEALSTVPEPSLSMVPISRLSRWQLLNQQLEAFWSQWSKDYLQRFLARYKWNRVQPSIIEGSIVLIVDERYPPSKWPLGRVVETRQGPDGLTRVVVVKTQTSKLERPITKICPLPIETSEN